MGGNRNHLSFLYLHPQICLWIAFRLWIRLSAVDTTLFMGRSLGDETSAIDYLLPNDGLLLISCFCYCFAMDQEVQQSIPLNPRNVPIIKEGDQHVSNFSHYVIFLSFLLFYLFATWDCFRNSYVASYYKLLDEFGGIFHEKQSLNN